MHGALCSAKEKTLLILSIITGIFLFLFFVFMCGSGLAVYSPLNFISDFVKW